MRNLMGQMPASPFAEAPKDEPKPADKLRGLVKPAKLSIRQDNQEIFLEFKFPPGADWHALLAYQTALQRHAGDDLIHSIPTLRRLDGNLYHFWVPKKKFTLDDVERWRRDIATNALSDDNLEMAAQDMVEIERRQAEDAAYAGRKRKFLTDLLASLDSKIEFNGDLPVGIRIGYGGFDYRLQEDDLLDLTLDEAFLPFWRAEEIMNVEDRLDALLGHALKLKTKVFHFEGGVPRTHESRQEWERKLQEAALGAFRKLLKSGPGRNKIKYELKKMSPDYKSRETK